MKINKYLIATLLAMCIIGFSMADVSAATVKVDGDWRLLHDFRVTDQSTGGSWTSTAAAGKSHKITVTDDHKFHQMLFSVETIGVTSCGYISLLVNVWDGSDVTLYSKLDAIRGAYYKHTLKYDVGELKGEINKSSAI